MRLYWKNNMSYNRRSLFGKLALVCQQYNIERSEVRLDGGGAALYYRLRDETADIDVSVDGVVFDRIVEENKLTTRLLPGLGLSFSTSVVSGSPTVRSSNSVIGCLTTGSDHTTFSRI